MNKNKKSVKNTTNQSQSYQLKNRLLNETPTIVFIFLLNRNGKELFS